MKYTIFTILFITGVVLTLVGCAKEQSKELTKVVDDVDIKAETIDVKDDTEKNEETEIDTSNWNSFTHKAYDYTINFPEDWYWNGTKVDTLVISNEPINSPSESYSINNLKVLNIDKQVVDQNTEVINLNSDFKLVYSKDSEIKEIIDEIANSFVVEEKTLTVKVYFIPLPVDDDCSEVVEKERVIDYTKMTATAAIKELLKGQLQSEGQVTSAIPKNTKLLSINIADSVAYADFSSQLSNYGGGSCHANAIQAQIEQTLKQFPTVDSVVISIEGETEGILQP